jgi:hypothetical protein
VLYSALATKGFCEEVLDEAAGDCVTIWSNPLKQELELLLARRHKIGPATEAAQAGYADLCEFVEPQPLPVREFAAQRAMTLCSRRRSPGKRMSS